MPFHWVAVCCRGFVGRRTDSGVGVRCGCGGHGLRTLCIDGIGETGHWTYPPLPTKGNLQGKRAHAAPFGRWCQAVRHLVADRGFHVGVLVDPHPLNAVASSRVACVRARVWGVAYWLRCVLLGTMYV